MYSKISSHAARGRVARAAACAWTLAAITLCAAGAWAEPGPAASEPMPLRASHLEKAFWVCDYVGTTEGVSAAPVAACSAITDALKNERFNGDFAQMVKWWEEHKRVRHEELARAAR